MTRRTQVWRIPKMCFHRASGQAVVRLGGKDKYLGRWKTAKAQAAYHRIVAEWLARGDRIAGLRPLETVGDLGLAYLAHAQGYYRKGDGVTSELSVLRSAWRFALALYADTDLDDFGPSALKTVRAEMIRAGLARRTINGHVHRLRRGWRWAAENELLDAELWHRLQSVSGLRPGRGGRAIRRRFIPPGRRAGMRPGGDRGLDAASIAPRLRHTSAGSGGPRRRPGGPRPQPRGDDGDIRPPGPGAGQGAGLNNGVAISATISKAYRRPKNLRIFGGFTIDNTRRMTYIIIVEAGGKPATHRPGRPEKGEGDERCGNEGV